MKYPLSISFNKVDSIVDTHIKQIVMDRLAEFGNKEKEAFKDLESKPIYADKAQQIKINSVRCFTGLSAVAPVKRNEQGEDIGFVKPGNNHHVAIYKDKDGKLQESVVTFWHAVERKKYKLPVIIKEPSLVEQMIAGLNVSDEFKSQLPTPDWTFEESLQENEMFILGMDEEAYQKAVAGKDYATLNKYLYRVQKISKSNYYFRFHLETMLDDSAAAKNIRKFYCIQSFKAWESLNPHKVQISLLGKLIVK